MNVRMILLITRVMKCHTVLYHG